MAVQPAPVLIDMAREPGELAMPPPAPRWRNDFMPHIIEAVIKGRGD